MFNRKKTLLILLSLLVAAGFLVGISGLILLRIGAISGNKNDLFIWKKQSSSDVFLARVQRFDEVKNVPEGLFNFGGSTSWIPIESNIHPVIEIVFPRFALRYTNPINGKPGSGTGIRMLLDNQLSFSLSSRSLKEEEYQEGINKRLNLKEIPIALDAITVAVHPDLNIPGLTVSQLKDIYSGKITNWSQVQGPNLPIIPYSRLPQDSGTVEFFVENVLEGEPFAKNLSLVDNTTIGLQQVSKNPGGIYYASAPEIIPQCRVKAVSIGQKLGELVSPYQKPFIPLSQCPSQRNQINREVIQSGKYPITRRLFVIVKQDNSIDEEAGIAYTNLLLSKEGQDLIEQAGFISLR